MVFRFLTEIRFVLTIADNFSAFSCPEGLVSQLPACGILFFSALANRISDPACPV
jgi:hypothetical protein